MNDKSLARPGQKALLYLVLVVISCMVEDFGQFRIALIVSIIIAELTLYFVQGTRPNLGRPWVGPLFAFLLTNLLLLLGGIFSLISEWYKD